MVNPGNAGINAGQFLAAESGNLKARMSDASADLITCLKVLEPTNWPNDDSRVICG